MLNFISKNLGEDICNCETWFSVKFEPGKDLFVTDTNIKKE
jgi:hypothetical protein